jgi:hypothetical protein
VSEHMNGAEGRTASGRWSSTMTWVAIAVLVAACSGTGTPAASTAGGGTTVASPAATVAPTAAATPASSEAAFVRPEPSALASAALEPALKELWTASGQTQNEPYVSQPAVDPQGRIWTASAFDHVFWIIDREGIVLESWGGAGAGDGDGEFNLVTEGNGGGDVVFRSDGGFYVADTGNARVQQFDAERGFVRSFGVFGTDPGEFVRPGDIDMDGDGNVYVYDVSRNDVQVFSQDGEFQRIAATQVGPYAAVDDAGNVYAVDNDHGVVLYRYTPDGTVDIAVGLNELVPFATGLVVGPTGDLFLTGSDNGGNVPTYLSLLQIDPAGTLKHLWPIGAEGVGVDPAGDRVYLTNGNQFDGAVRAYALTSG